MISLEEVLLTYDNVNLANKVLSQFEEEYQKIASPKEILVPVDVAQLDERLKDVVKKISAMLDISLDIDASCPRIIAGPNINCSFYNDNRLFVAESHRIEYEIYSTLAHEYSHFLQYLRVGFCSQWHSHALREGFARGVEFLIAKQYAEEKKEPLYMKGALELAIKSLSKFSSSIILGIYHRPLSKETEDSRPYCFGVTAVMIAENLHGEGIYKEIFHSRYPYDELVYLLRGKQ